MKFTQVNELSFISKGTKKGTIKKCTWMNNLGIGDAKVYKSTSPVILRRVRARVYSYNKVTGKKLSVRRLTDGGFAVIRTESVT